MPTVSRLSWIIAFLLEGIRISPQGKEVSLRTATPAKCNDGGDYQGAGTSEVTYVLRANKLEKHR
jgi:hypothetical protein